MPGPTDTPQMRRIRKRNRLRSVERQLEKLKDERKDNFRVSPASAGTPNPYPKGRPGSYRRKKRRLPKYGGNDPSGYGPKLS